MPADDEEANTEPVVAPEAEGAAAAASAPESPESSPSGEEDWVKVAEAAPETVDAAIETAAAVPAGDAVVEVVEASVAGECDARGLVVVFDYGKRTGTMSFVFVQHSCGVTIDGRIRPFSTACEQTVKFWTMLVLEYS